MSMEALRQPSLVRRLVILAAGWSLAVLLVSAIVLAMLFQQAAIRRFDQGLSELIDNLTAGTTIADKGEVVAPALTDLRALRAFSGKYWQIAEPGKDGKLQPFAPMLIWALKKRMRRLPHPPQRLPSQ